MNDRVIDGPVFHTGEVAAQAQLGIHDKMQAIGASYIRPYFLEQHLDFYNQLPFIVVAACDENGLPWVTILTGEPGFISSTDDQHLQITSQLAQGDALEKSLLVGASVGLIGIEFATKRRNRANGKLSGIHNDGLSFKVSHSYGNCPKYITPKATPIAWNSKPKQPASVAHHQHLTPDMQRWITQADSLFIGSGNGQLTDNEQTQYVREMDASHRGGPAGFVKVMSDNELILPDYRGNNFFNTIGNILLDPQIGLLFIDFKSGSMLQMTGQARVEWSEPEQAQFAGAQRLIHIKINKAVMLKY
jgi:predicted pyridoxine 5'-phosphate oxidase superfamily flavin-nucleotide-binding protein